MVQRLTYRKRHSYATRSNQTRVVKTPGGKLTYQTAKKRAKGPRCPVTGKRIQGLTEGNSNLDVLYGQKMVKAKDDDELALQMYRAAREQLEHMKLVSKLLIPHLRPTEYKRSRLARNQRTVNRAYGGVLSGSAVKERIIRAFLVEEQKIVKKVLKFQKTKEKATKS